MKGAIYSRFSTDRQTDSSITDQVRVCTEYSDRQGWRVTECFEDHGISGAALGNRPGVLRLQEAALARRIDVVLVTDLSRLSRSNGDLSKMIDRLVARGIRVVGVQDGYDSARRGHKLQSGLSGIIGEAFREMVKDRTYAALESRAKGRRPTGGCPYGYTAATKISPSGLRLPATESGLVEIDRGEAFIVNEIFGRYADGQSTLTISKDLNARRIPSPGSSWKRETRRANGWMASTIRVIVRNERYRGVVHWNTSEWRKDPDSGKRVRVQRPRSEWISYCDETQRIVSDELWARAERRYKGVGQSTPRPGGSRYPRKFLLSGLLRCDVCDAHYVMCNAREYGCSSHRLGGACSNGVRISREVVQNKLFGKLREDLLAPESVNTIAQEMQAYYLEQTRAQESRTAEAPRELQELTARIARLRERLRAGDPDMAADELQAAIDRAESKRRELVDQQPAAKESAKVLKMMPKAAEAARREIAAALAGDSRASLKARTILRDVYEGKIRLKPQPGGGLTAHWNLQPAALLKSAAAGAVACGSGGRI